MQSGTPFGWLTEAKHKGLRYCWQRQGNRFYLAALIEAGEHLKTALRVEAEHRAMIDAVGFGSAYDEPAPIAQPFPQVCQHRCERGFVEVYEIENVGGAHHVEALHIVAIC